MRRLLPLAVLAISAGFPAAAVAADEVKDEGVSVEAHLTDEMQEEVRNREPAGEESSGDFGGLALAGVFGLAFGLVAVALTNTKGLRNAGDHH